MFVILLFLSYICIVRQLLGALAIHESHLYSCPFVVFLLDPSDGQTGIHPFIRHSILVW